VAETPALPDYRFDMLDVPGVSNPANYQVILELLSTLD
jgi:hypothetical protein